MDCKRIGYLIIIGVFISNGILCQSRKAQRVAKKREQQAVDNQQEKKQEIEELTIFLKDKHYLNQSKEVQKRMRKSEKKAKKIRKNKKNIFLRRKIKKKRSLNIPLFKKSQMK